MLDFNKKYKTQASDAYPNIGQLLEEHILANKIYKATLARQLGIAGTGIGKYLERESIQMGILWKLSLAMKYNFIGVVAEAFPIAHHTEKELELEKKLLEKETYISDLEKELAVYKTILNR